MLYKIEKAIKNISEIVDIKLEKCDVYKEYSVVVLYKDDSDIIICDSGRDAETLYRLLTQRINSQNPEGGIMLYKIEKAIKNISDIVDIKLEKCDVYKEYSVVVLYKDDSDIIICDSGRDAETLYKLLTQRINSQNPERDIEREEGTPIES